MNTTKRKSIVPQIIIFSLGRTILNTGFRMVYPFLPAFSRALNVDMSVVALAVSIRSWTGLASPLFGSLADTRGRKVSMLVGMGIFSTGFFVVFLWPSLPGLFIALLLSAGAKILLDPAVQAFLGDHVVYSRRGTAIAITELSWSTAYILGIPLVGFLITNWDWRAPFLWLSCMGIIAAALIYQFVPGNVGKSHAVSLRGSLRNIISHPSALAGISIGMLISAGNETVTIIYGAWMEGAFQISVAALGLASTVIGLAELSGEGSVAVFADRIGKRNSVGIGLLANVAACLLLPWLGQNLSGALFGLFIFYLSFEFTLVSSIPVMTELVPEARATTMSALIAGFAAGRGIGALLGPLLFGYGLIANTALSAACGITAFVLLVTFVRE
jgi:predicted MFS family arabinose efflux permease